MLEGFLGYKSVKQLIAEGFISIPKERGVYVVLYPNDGSAEFLSESTAGHFMGKDPTVLKNELKDRWIEGERILYIGKAGSEFSKSSLRNIIRLSVKYGRGSPVGHQGGKYIWQIKDAEDLVFTWKVTKEDPYYAETEIMNAFIKKHDRMPFANLIN